MWFDLAQKDAWSSAPILWASRGEDPEKLREDPILVGETLTAAHMNAAPFSVASFRSRSEPHTKHNPQSWADEYSRQYEYEALDLSRAHLDHRWGSDQPIRYVNGIRPIEGETKDGLVRRRGGGDADE